MNHDPLQPHSHPNNDRPPNDDTTIRLWLDGDLLKILTLPALATYPQAQLRYSYTTDHGVHGPYLLGGVALRTLVANDVYQRLREIEVVSADGFGNRIFVAELGEQIRPILLVTHSDGVPLTRQRGLVRLLVPSETDNALRQIKWVETIRLITQKGA